MHYVHSVRMTFGTKTQCFPTYFINLLADLKASVQCLPGLRSLLIATPGFFLADLKQMETVYFIVCAVFITPYVQDFTLIKVACDRPLVYSIYRIVEIGL